MPRLCIAQAHVIGPLMQQTDDELKTHLETAVAEDTVDALHLCHELLVANRQRGDADRNGLETIVAGALNSISDQLKGYQ